MTKYDIFLKKTCLKKKKNSQKIQFHVQFHLTLPKTFKWHQEQISMSRTKLDDVFYTFSEFLNKKMTKYDIFLKKTCLKKKKNSQKIQFHVQFHLTLPKTFKMASGTDFHVENKLDDVFYTFSEFLNKK